MTTVLCLIFAQAFCLVMQCLSTARMDGRDKWWFAGNMLCMVTVLTKMTFWLLAR